MSGPFEAELAKQLNAEIERLKEEAGAGMLPDFAAYKTTTAQINAYKRVLTEFIPNVGTELAKR